METNILAVIIQEGSKIASEFLRQRKTAITSQPVDLEKFINESELRFRPLISSPEEINQPNDGQHAVIKINTGLGYVPPPQEVVVEEEKATTIATGCVPCAMGHFGTCTGILNESLRFAHGQEGMASPEVIDRVNMCMDELNAMERVDLRPEMTVQLTGWEKELAERALTESRGIRHALEGIQDVNSLEAVAAKTQTTRKEIGRTWFQNKLQNMSPTDKDEIKRRVMAKIEEMASAEA